MQRTIITRERDEEAKEEKKKEKEKEEKERKKEGGRTRVGRRLLLRILEVSVKMKRLLLSLLPEGIFIVDIRKKKKKMEDIRKEKKSRERETKKMKMNSSLLPRNIDSDRQM